MSSMLRQLNLIDVQKRVPNSSSISIVNESGESSSPESLGVNTMVIIGIALVLVLSLILLKFQMGKSANLSTGTSRDLQMSSREEIVNEILRARQQIVNTSEERNTFTVEIVECTSSNDRLPEYCPQYELEQFNEAQLPSEEEQVVQ